MQNNIDYEFGMCYCDKMHIKRLTRRVGDKMVNVNKLKGKIVECGLSIEELAKRIGKDRATLYRRLNSESPDCKHSDQCARPGHSNHGFHSTVTGTLNFGN